MDRGDLEHVHDGREMSSREIADLGLHRLHRHRNHRPMLQNRSEGVCLVLDSGKFNIDPGKHVVLELKDRPKEWLQIVDLATTAGGWAVEKLLVNGDAYMAAPIVALDAEHVLYAPIDLAPTDTFAVQVRRVAPEHGRCVLAIVAVERPEAMAHFWIPPDKIDPVEYTAKTRQIVKGFGLRTRVHRIAGATVNGRSIFADAQTLLEANDVLTIDVANAEGDREQKGKTLLEVFGWPVPLAQVIGETELYEIRPGAEQTIVAQIGKHSAYVLERIACVEGFTIVQAQVNVDVELLFGFDQKTGRPQPRPSEDLDKQPSFERRVAGGGSSVILIVRNESNEPRQFRCQVIGRTE